MNLVEQVLHQAITRVSFCIRITMTPMKQNISKRENLLRTIRRDAPAYVPYRYDGCLTILDSLVTARPRGGGRDDWGVGWCATHTDEGSYPDGKAILTIEQVGDFRAPATDFSAVTADLQNKVRAHAGEDTLLIVRNEAALFERPTFLLGMTEFLMACMTNPAEVHRIFDVIAEYQVQLLDAFMQAGVDGVRFTDDWGMQNAMFLRPAMWREFIKPRLARMYDVVKQYNGIVFQHSCGCIDEIVPDLVELRLDVLDPCQPQSNDIFAWKKNFGRSLCFMGGLDTQTYLPFGTPDEIRRKVIEVLGVMSENGGYIAAPSHTITLPEENRRAMLEAIEEFNDRM